MASVRLENVRKIYDGGVVGVHHDQTEAMTMEEKIVVMSGGFVQQIDSPLAIYNHPAPLYNEVKRISLRCAYQR